MEGEDSKAEFSYYGKAYIKSEFLFYLMKLFKNHPKIN